MQFEIKVKVDTTKVLDAAEQLAGWMSFLETLAGEKPAKKAVPKATAPMQMVDEKVEPPKKKAEPKQTPAPEKVYTLKDDLIPGFKKYSAEHSRQEALDVLKKFNVKSVNDLKPEVYPQVMVSLGLR